jgi:membrane fusion protein, multidrug efflux system
LGLLKHHPVFVILLLGVLTVAGFTTKTYFDNQRLASGWGGGGAISVVTEKVTQQTITDAIESIGTTQANESVSLTSKVTDTVRKVNFDDGDLVDTGAILIELTNTEETAMLAEAQATLDEAARQLLRIQNMIDQKLASERQLDEALGRQQTAAARLEAVLAKLDDRLIRAPFAGTLGFRNVSPGTLLSPGTVVTTLDDISVIKLNFTIPENYLAVIEPGQAVSAMSVAYPGEAFSGHVATINSRVDPVTRAVGIRAMLNNEQRLLRPGMLLTVSLTRDKSPALVVAEEAIVPIQSKEYVYVISPEDKAERVQISTGRRRPGIVEVLSGLTEGQEVVTQGVIKMRPGALIARKGETRSEEKQPW